MHHRYVRMFDYSIKIVNSLFSLDKNVQNSFLFPSIHITCKYLQCLINVCINIIGFTSLASYAADAALTFSWIVFRLVQITSSTQRLSPLLAHHRRYFKINLYLLFFSCKLIFIALSRITFNIKCSKIRVVHHRIFATTQWNRSTHNKRVNDINCGRYSDSLNITWRYWSTFNFFSFLATASIPPNAQGQTHADIFIHIQDSNILHLNAIHHVHNIIDFQHRRRNVWRCAFFGTQIRNVVILIWLSWSWIKWYCVCSAMCGVWWQLIYFAFALCGRFIYSINTPRALIVHPSANRAHWPMVIYAELSSSRLRN